MSKIQKYFHPITKLPRYRASTEEPAPTKGNQEVLDAVINDFRDKAIAGTEKYGTLLETFNGRDAANDAYQELIDLVMYFQQLRMEWIAIRETIQEYFRLKKECDEIITSEEWEKVPYDEKVENFANTKRELNLVENQLRKMVEMENVP